MAPEARPADNVFNETHWSDPESEPCKKQPYFESKTLAEKAAWDYVEKLPVDEKFELVTICPSFIMGPPLKKNETGTSFGFMRPTCLDRTRNSAQTLCSLSMCGMWPLPTFWQCRSLKRMVSATF